MFEWNYLVNIFSRDQIILVEFEVIVRGKIIVLGLHIS